LSTITGRGEGFGLHPGIGVITQPK